MPKQLADQRWVRDLREIRQVVFTRNYLDGTLSAAANHQFRFVEETTGEKSWESGPAVEATQTELLACHPQAAEVLAALTELFHAKADQAQA